MSYNTQLYVLFPTPRNIICRIKIIVTINRYIVFNKITIIVMINRL